MSRPSTMFASSSDHTQGTANSRASLFPQSHQPGSRLHAKQQELQGLKELKEYSARLLRQLEIMGSGLEAIKMGEESVAQVMSSWQTVFRGIQVAQESILAKTTSQDPSSSSVVEGTDAGVGGGPAATSVTNLVPDTLVRIPLDQSSINDTVEVAMGGATGGGSREEGIEG